jgi:hypothetical protein
MAQISRKYDFTAGTTARSAQVDDEFNQLVANDNEQDTRIEDRYTKAQVDEKVNKATASNVILAGDTLPTGSYADGQPFYHNVEKNLYIYHAASATWNVSIPASQILTLLKTVDGAGSGLDADLVQGISGANMIHTGNEFIVPGATILAEALTEETVASTSDSERKAFKVFKPGKYRVTGEIKIGLTGQTATVLLYVNGTYASVQFATTSTTYVSFSMDLPDNYLAYYGDLIQVYLRSTDNTVSAYIRNVRLQGDQGALPAIVVTNT